MSSAFLGVQLAIAMARREMNAEGIDCSKVGIVIELPHNEFRRFLLSAADYQRFAGVPIDVEATEFMLMGAIVRRQALKQIAATLPTKRPENDRL